MSMKQVILRALALSIALGLVIFAGCRYTPPESTRQQAIYPEHLENEPDIRIRIGEYGSPVTLLVSGPYKLEVTHVGGRKETGGGNSAVSIDVEATQNGVRLGRDLFTSASIIPVGNTRLGLRTQIDGVHSAQELSGSLHFNRTKDSKLQAIVEIGLEEYLIGVVPHEMPASWGTDALKTQAVAARSYALYHIKTRGNKEYDVKNTVMSQVWKPVTRADPRVALAVNSTRGIVVLENSRLFPTYFHSRCGGRTADARFVFQQGDITALSGVDCKYCLSKNAPRPWSLTIALDDLSARLNERGLVTGQVERIRALSEDKQPLSIMRRVYWVEVTTKAGTRHIIPADTFRRAVGHEKNNLASTWFSVTQNAAYVTFEGQGHGHGVGLCQYGARYLAEQLGYDYVSIIKAYYPGTTVSRVY